MTYLFSALALPFRAIQAPRVAKVAAANAAFVDVDPYVRPFREGFYSVHEFTLCCVGFCEGGGCYKGGEVVGETGYACAFAVGEGDTCICVG
eukprot:3370167-Rhodomonas_salina.1